MAWSSFMAIVDGFVSRGLYAVVDSIGYKVARIDRHLHGWESWFGVAAVPTATHKADRVNATTNYFEADSGNAVWGAWLQVLGADDTPSRSGSVSYDFHRLEIIAAERSSVYKIQISFGATGDGGVTAGTYTELVYNPVSITFDSGPVDVMIIGRPAGTLAWVRVGVPDDTGWLRFYFGIHEYEG